MSGIDETALFRVLGPIRLSSDAGDVAVRAGRERVVLATLLLHAGELVTMQQLVEGIWAEEPPRNARNQVQGCVSRLRRQLVGAGISAGMVVTDGDGYRLRIDPRRVDLYEFRARVTAARAAASDGPADKARDLYRSALELWRGPALAGVESDLIRRYAEALDDERVQVMEEFYEAELALGKAGELVADLAKLARQYPFRERLHGSFMLALYRAGRPADALAAFRNARDILRKELGIEPGAELQRLHQAILNRDSVTSVTPRANGAASSQPTPRELPADVAGFVGRQAALQALNELLVDEESILQAPVTITAITGSAGVGKTALAVHWAHRVTDRFPDGQLCINLRGYASDAPLRPIEALASLLRSLGTSPAQIPSNQAEAARLFRSRLAGKRILVLLDNAGSVEQVRPLLPGSSGCLVLVTSRDRLSGLVARDGAHRLSLGVLTGHESYELFSRILGEERVRTESDAVKDLAGVCAHLPLAIRIAAANLIDAPHRMVSVYVTELASGDRVSALHAGGDLEAAVRATFETSYAALSPEAQRMFRLIGLVPGPHFTPAVGAALAGATVETARRSLDSLASVHLIDEFAANRFAFHDLLRVYAKSLATVGAQHEERAAVPRLLQHYLLVVDKAVEQLYPAMLRLPMSLEDMAAVPLVDFATPSEARAWLDAELPNIIAAVKIAAEGGPPSFAWLLADRLRSHIWYRGTSLDWTVAAKAALAAAEREGDLRAQAITHFGSSEPHLIAGRYAQAEEHLRTALDCARLSGWLAGQAVILGHLGFVHWSLGDLPRAADCVNQAEDRYRQTGKVAGQAACRGNLGTIQRERGLLREAESHHTEAIRLFRRARVVEGEANNLSNLGQTLHDLGHLDRAAEHLSTALRSIRDLGYRHAEAETLHRLAELHLSKGMVDSALATARTAVTLANELGDRRAEAEALNILGRAHLATGEPGQAVGCHERALDIARDTGDRSPEACALLGLAAATRSAMSADAHQNVCQAHAIAKGAGYRVIEGRALTMLAENCFEQGNYDDANELARKALASHRETGHRLGEAKAIMTLARILQAAGDKGAAREAMRDACDLFQEVGAPVPVS